MANILISVPVCEFSLGLQKVEKICKLAHYDTCSDAYTLSSDHFNVMYNSIKGTNAVFAVNHQNNVFYLGSL